MLTLNFTEGTDRLKKRLECIRWLSKHKVDVGLTSSASDRSRFLLAIHTHGSPVMRIPPRPVVEPALAQESVRTEMAGYMAEACAAAMKGDPEGTVSAMEASGQAGADGIRDYIDRGVPPSNAPVTLTGGWIYNHAAKKGVPVKGKSGDTPLKDTGQMYNDFDYAIKER